MTLLYAFGSNGNGQLGVGHVDDINVPQRCIGIPETESLVKVVGGGNHAAALTKNGHVYMTGDIVKSTQFHRPLWLQDQKWIDVACGWSFTLVVSDQGRVYGFGTGRSGELGNNASANNKTLTTATDLVTIDLDTKIVSVACGWRHAIALDEQGQVYGWGWNRHGQLGEIISQKPYIQAPRLIQFISQQQKSPIVQIACGHTFSMLLAQDGTLYGFGSNKYGQLDVLENVKKLTTARISTGWHHVAAGTTSTEKENPLFQLYAWGRNDHAQTVSFPNTVNQFVCGSEHMLVVHDSKVYAWGWNEHGNCTSNKESVLKPLEITGLLPNHHIALLGAGCATSWIAMDPFIVK
ncbi:regulator of chromosome condensation 1/beta-lactamase-inhibitor protein II [Phascolomyces articulosus]|uniref:Regulator of chromosome condensation 1/beta-lactamase-inhibitor protein II n=1 Tax=Phascolomyces articulosus TaxID=60185 RepID=A0AAD5PDR3_9FUNG|nr:regulator of chromosome condensation 1/beta-lactamase-inhibitor protein II [Phascolomyces articulosus]